MALEQVQCIVQEAFSVHLWNLFLVLGFLAGLAVLIFEGKREGVPGKELGRLFLWIVLGAVLGMRLFYLFFFKPSSGWNLQGFIHCGNASMGAFIGVILAIILASRLAKRDFWEYADISALGVSLAAVFVKLGCHLANCCCSVGKQTSLPWAVVQQGAGHHPTALYAIIYNSVIFLVLWSLRKRKLFSGFLFLLFLILYSSCRLLFENFYRVDIGLYYQFLPLTLLIPAAVLMWYKARKTG
ncbi:hypothetical protein GF351_04860 [Candidatus Woesearchaeota archaeon]|nr:hypothetical protein [Candidatus Woesearchaeota archaeon]